MATLSTAERSQISAALQRWWSNLRESCGFTKPDLLAAIDATDAWIDANAAVYNAALPQPFRGSATPLQKTLLFCYVAIRRAKRDGADVPMVGE